MIRSFLITAAVISLAACSGAKDSAVNSAKNAAQTVGTAANNAADQAQEAAQQTAVATRATSKAAAFTPLTEILAAQPDTVKARYNARRPKDTLEFFGVKPGMAVAEILPGGGWYTKIMGPYLGTEGHIIGIDYNIGMWAEFGGFATPKFIEDRKGWAKKWETDMAASTDGPMSHLSGHSFNQIPANYNGQVDMVIMVRALHNLARFNDKGGYMDAALSQLHGLLKPGGIVGIVQHQAPENIEDNWADGNNGYLKASYVIAQMEKAGFELAAESDINANPRDIPTTDDNVWRLPPTLGTSRENPELRSKMQAIGESNRMTLKFIKPA